MQTELNESNETADIPETQTSEGTSTESGGADAQAGSAGDAGSEAQAEETAAVEIDGQRFRSEAEALAWAKQNLDKLKTEQAIAEAYRTGIADATQNLAPQAPKPEVVEDDEPNFEEEFYKDPKAALKRRDERIAAKIKQEVFGSLKQTEVEREIWDRFTASHPDLADFKEDVEYFVNHPQNSGIVSGLAQTKGQEAAMNYVAQKVRAKFQNYIQASKQKTVLPRGNGTVATPTGNQKPVTQTPKQEKPVSMRDQLRQLKSKQQR